MSETCIICLMTRDRLELDRALLILFGMLDTKDETLEGFIKCFCDEHATSHKTHLASRRDRAYAWPVPKMKE